jgi:aldose 1-epimerase
MFTAENNKSHIELADRETNSKAIISLNAEGGRLKYLSFHNKTIIDDLEKVPYSKSHAGAVLFPFANRVNKGEYDFEGRHYKLNCNEPERDNAIHGLVFDKVFSVDEITESKSFAEVSLSYTETNPPEGFPFAYKVELIYKLKKNNLDLKVKVHNIGSQNFPFNLGWHPYFCVDDFDNSFLSFQSHKQVIFNENLISLGTAETLIPDPYSLKDKKLDDCFVLYDKNVELFTSNYRVSISGKPKSDYLQIYAPPHEKRLAVEPMTGISDSFNHKRGIHILKPNHTKKETWSIKFITK